MHVFLLNGSPKKDGCTFTALSEVAGALEKHGITTEIFQLGTQPVRGCIDCGACRKTGQCVFDDMANEVLEKMSAADGVVIGSPVYYGSANGSLTALLDRVFFVGSSRLAHKPGAAVVSARRAGATASLDQLNKYFMLAHMPVVSSQYWNMVHGMDPDEVRQDREGLQTMRMLGDNMAWLLQCIAAGQQNGVVPPAPQERDWTNFIH